MSERVFSDGERWSAAEYTIRCELRQGLSRVTPGGLKYWPALDAFDDIVGERDFLRHVVRSLCGRPGCMEHDANGRLVAGCHYCAKHEGVK